MFAFLRYIFGFVRFTATGGFTERFINLAAGKRIPIWNSKNTSSGFIGDTTISGYREMAEIAKKSGVKLHMLGKHGLPFFYKKIHLRAGLFISGRGITVLRTVGLLRLTRRGMDLIGMRIAGIIRLRLLILPD